MFENGKINFEKITYFILKFLLHDSSALHPNEMFRNQNCQTKEGRNFCPTNSGLFRYLLAVLACKTDKKSAKRSKFKVCSQKNFPRTIVRAYIGFSSKQQSLSVTFVQSWAKRKNPLPKIWFQTLKLARNDQTTLHLPASFVNKLNKFWWTATEVDRVGQITLCVQFFQQTATCRSIWWSKWFSLWQLFSRFLEPTRFSKFFLQKKIRDLLRPKTVLFL